MEKRRMHHRGAAPDAVGGEPTPRAGENAQKSTPPDLTRDERPKRAESARANAPAARSPRLRSWIAAAILLAGCDRTPDASHAAAPRQGPVSRAVPGCGAAIDAPDAFRTEATERQQEHLRLLGPDGVTLSVSCLPKRSSGPMTLVELAQWVLSDIVKLDRANGAGRTRKTDEPPIDGRPVLALETDTDAGGRRSTLLFTERAQVFYWVEYTAPASSWDKGAEGRTTLLRSFRVTDPGADRGPTRWWHPEVKEDPRTLAEARAAFRTKVRKGRPEKGFDGLPAPMPPRGTFEKVHVKGPVGRLTAYITPDPKDSRKHPAVVWAHGGFGGIDRWFWEAAPRSNDQSARAFREAGIVLAVGSWRAENDNPGDYELYYGEVDDLLALRDHVAKRPYVDPDRIYLAGHSSGGTLVLLAAERSDGFRAAFSIGGSPLFRDPASYDPYGGVPFDPTDAAEVLLRSAAPFVRSIRRPTFYFEGSGSSHVGLAQWMADRAAQAGVPFQAFTAMQADHFSILAPLTELLAKKIVADTGAAAKFGFTQEEIDRLRVEE
ncbi:prolyl oligopeptidase family serine peptidase [Sorangium sp. So ce296]|uniref:alpha/beta hydrolase family protein n=1 Tax=Sorangium sp. So ce296 TaxID=3133296 RepID=UPI003F60242A